MLRRELLVVRSLITLRRYLLAAIFSCLFFVIPARAVTTTWVGADNGSWNAGTNWSTGLVPTAADDVVIAPGTYMSIRAPFNGAGPTVGINFKSLTISTSSFVLYGYGIISGGDITINDSALFTLQVAQQKQIISGNLTVSGTLQTDVNTGTFFPLRFRANNIIVSGSNSSIRADGSGYVSNGAGATGSGPGAGLGSGTVGGGGGGHYGAGGDGAGATGSGGAAYCSSTNPVTYGSSGGGGQTGSGGRGGGLILLESYNTTTFSAGQLSASGEIGSNWGGGGAGGSVSLLTRNLVFNASSLYTYGASGGSLGGGGGGGGCVLVKYIGSNNLTTSSILVSGGNSGVSAATGSPGSFLIQQITTLISPPTAPTSTSNVSSNTIRYNWTGGGGLENYFILDRSIDGSAYSFVTTSNISPSSSPTGTFSYDFTSLNPNQRYWFRVAAGDGIDATSSYVTSSPVYTLAQTVNAPTVSLVATTSLQLTLDTATNPSTTLYSLFNTTTQSYVTASGTATGTPAYFASSSWGGQVTGLTPGTSYRFVVIPRNNDGLDSATSSASTATTTLSAIVPNTPSLTVSNPTTTTLQLTINTNSNSSTTLYALYNTTTASYIDAMGNYSATPVYFTSSTWNNGNAQGLATDTPYSFVAIAQSTDQIFATSSPTAVSYTRPASGGITPLTVGTSTISFSFVTNGNPSTTRYSIFYISGSSIYLTPSGTVSTTAQFFTSSSWQNIPLQNLAPSTTFTFFINAVGNPSNLFQTGSATQVTTTTLPVPVPNTPGVPTLGTVTSDTIQFSTFNASTTNGNSATTTYAIFNTNANVFVDAAGVTTTAAVFQVSSSWSGITLKNLLPLTFYGYRTIAFNGLAQVTSTLSITPLTGPAMVPAPTLTIGTSTVQITVNVGTNALGSNPLRLRILNITDNVYITASGTATTTAVNFATSSWNNGTVTGLTPNTAYQFGLVPLNGNFVAAPTTTFSFTTQAVSSGSSGGGGSTVTYGGGGGGGAVYYFSGATTMVSSTPVSTTSTVATSTPIASSTPVNAASSSSGIPFGPGWVFPAVGTTGVLPASTTATPISVSPIQFFGIPVTPVKLGQSFTFRYTAQNTTASSRTVRIERVLLNSRGTVVTRATALSLQRPGQIFASSPRVTLSRALSAGSYTIRVRILSTTGRVLSSSSFPLTVSR